MASGGGVSLLPWYATGFRKDQLSEDLEEIAAISTRYGCTSYWVFRSRDDRYKFQQFNVWESHVDWERYWDGPDMSYFRATHSGWFQVPLLYSWWDLTASGGLEQAPPELIGGTANGETA
jgi:quinol monooxygenase YgiN